MSPETRLLAQSANDMEKAYKRLKAGFRLLVGYADDSIFACYQNIVGKTLFN